MTHRMLAVILSLGLCVSLHAQQGGSSTILRVEITSSSPSTCNAHKDDVLVVHERRDRPFYAATHVEGCHWEATVPLYHTNNDRFSVRVRGMGRSDCNHPEWDEGTETGGLTYECCGEGDPHQLLLTMKDAVPFRYARTFLKSDCTDQGQLAGSGIDDTRTINAVQFEMERVRLQVFDVRTPPCSLSVNNVRRMLKAKPGASVEITRADAEAALLKQGVRAESCRATDLSVADVEATRKLQFRSVTIKVD
jgi:hypothetical protein